jgi:hypothetical protein
MSSLQIVYLTCSISLNFLLGVAWLRRLLQEKEYMELNRQFRENLERSRKLADGVVIKDGMAVQITLIIATEGGEVLPGSKVWLSLSEDGMTPMTAVCIADQAGSVTFYGYMGEKYYTMVSFPGYQFITTAIIPDQERYFAVLNKAVSDDYYKRMMDENMGELELIKRIKETQRRRVAGEIVPGSLEDRMGA